MLHAQHTDDMHISKNILEALRFPHYNLHTLY